MTSRPLPLAEDLLRALAPQVLGVLVRRHGQFDACEDAVQEALLAAALQWPEHGVPANPSGWLLTVASRRLTDEWRSERARRDREAAVAARDPQLAAAGLMPPPGDEADQATDRDDTLKLLFLCCHPALSAPSQVALTLRAVGGLTTAQIASAFLVPEATMATRISRAKQRIKAAGASFAMPPAAERVARLQAVLHVLYLTFNEGYTASSGPDLQRGELTAEAIRLTRELHRLLPDDGEVAGLLALMLLTDARRAARSGPDGALIPIAEQDRSRWNRAAIEEGVALISHALTWSPPGPYQLQAAIAAVHVEAPCAADTDWRQIEALYRLLARAAPSPMVTLNQAVAVGMVRGPSAGLELLRSLDEDHRMAGHHRLAAVRAHLLEMAGDQEAARTAYRDAARRTTSRPEQRYLEAKAARLAARSAGEPMQPARTQPARTQPARTQSARTQHARTQPPRTRLASTPGPATATLPAPGATLYYEVRGTGPVLLMICGGIYDAAAFAPLARLLAERYTVLTYDRRGNSRSPLDGPPGPQRIEDHADDAHRLLSAIGDGGPAYVFGNSSGAVVGLALAVSHPEQVRALVAHEPPVFELLPERERWRDTMAGVDRTYRAAGAEAAMAKLTGAMTAEGEPRPTEGGQQEPRSTEAGPQESRATETGPQRPPSPELAEMMARFQKNTGFFLGFEVLPFSRYTPDLAALRAAPTRVVLAAGRDSAGEPPHLAALAIAERLGTDAVFLPGDHGGFGTQASEFAARLHEIFASS